MTNLLLKCSIQFNRKVRVQYFSVVAFLSSPVLPCQPPHTAHIARQTLLLQNGKISGGLVNRPILRGIFDAFSLLEAVHLIRAFSCLRLLSTSFPVLLLLNLLVFLSIFKKFCFVLSVTSFFSFFSCQHPKSACSPR